MTGYGRAEGPSALGRLVVEIQSVNRKYLEMTVFTPKELSRFEMEIRKRVAKSISRGQMSIRVHLHPDEKSFSANLCIFKVLKKHWSKIAKDLRLDEKSVDLPFLVNQSKNFSQLEDLNNLESFRKSLLKYLEKALSAIVKMKNTEGRVLIEDIKKRFQRVEDNINIIAKKAPDATCAYQNKLKEKLESIFGKNEENEERAFREAILLAEKIDVTEEVIRVKSHLKQFKTLFTSKELSIGRKMDFLTQEMMREVNTIAAKSSDATISAYVVEIKSELEKIREQLQNIE